MKDRVHVGVIGAGRIGALHAAHLVTRIPEAEVIAISDIRYGGSALRERAGYPGSLRGSLSQCSRTRGSMPFWICSSTDTHAELAERAAAARKQIFQ